MLVETELGSDFVVDCEGRFVFVIVRESVTESLRVATDTVGTVVRLLLSLSVLVAVKVWGNVSVSIVTDLGGEIERVLDFTLDWLRLIV